jgi:hypothetical protein
MYDGGRVDGIPYPRRSERTYNKLTFSAYVKQAGAQA